LLKVIKISVKYFLLVLILITGNFFAQGKNNIFPIPQYAKNINGNLVLGSKVSILLPVKKSENDDFIGSLIQTEIVNNYRIVANFIKTNELPVNKKYILIGTLNNPLIHQYCEQNSLTEKVKELGSEGYILTSTDNEVVIASTDIKGAIYGFQSLRQLFSKKENKIVVPKIIIKDKPILPLRGIKLYLPGRNNIPFFKRFIKNFVSKYKFNTIILELNANMHLESHPELNVGTLKFGEELYVSRRGRPAGPHKEYQNSSHQDVADGEILEKREVGELVNYIRKYNIQIIPEIPSLTHSYYLLFGHKELAEITNSEYPDTYCPLKPEIYKIYFDVLEEYIDVIHPSIIHVGHDEWRMEKDVCNLCKGKNYGELFARDLIKIHDFLASKGIRTAIWGDHLLESVRGVEHRVWKTSAGYKYKIPGALTLKQVKELIPKDILIFNWFWGKTKDKGPGNDLQLADLGFEQVYGNFRPDIIGWKERLNIKGLLGGAPSSWAATTEINFGKDLIYDFLGCSNLLWSKHYQTPEQMVFITQNLIPTIRAELSGKILPSKTAMHVSHIDLDDFYNSKLNKEIDSINISREFWKQTIKNNQNFRFSKNGVSGVVAYSVENKSLPQKVEKIKINKDVLSLIFLHAAAKEGVNKKAYGIIYNPIETAELLGWYEIVYEDGFVATIPLRYGINILDWNVKNRIGKKGKSKYSQNKYAYETKVIDLPTPDKYKKVSFFAYEWINKRPGKKISYINLKTVNYKKGHSNAIILLAINEVNIKKRKEIKGKESE